MRVGIHITPLIAQAHTLHKEKKMSHFAKVENGIVTQVIVAEQDVIDSGLLGSGWIKTSYNTHGNVHYGEDGQPDGGIALRGNYAGIGYIYNSEKDVFYSQPLFNSWVMNESTWTWEAPVALPSDAGQGDPRKKYTWDENIINWVEVI